MKKRNIVCLVFLMCIVSSMLLPVCAMGIGNDTVEPQRYYATGKVVAESGVKLRSTPEKLEDNSNSMYLLPNNHTVRIIQQLYSDDGISWYYVMTYWAGENQYGYVAAQYVRIISGSWYRFPAVSSKTYAARAIIARAASLIAGRTNDKPLHIHIPHTFMGDFYEFSSNLAVYYTE